MAFRTMWKEKNRMINCELVKQFDIGRNGIKCNKINIDRYTGNYWGQNDQHTVFYSISNYLFHMSFSGYKKIIVCHFSAFFRSLARWIFSNTTCWDGMARQSERCYRGKEIDFVLEQKFFILLNLCKCSIKLQLSINYLISFHPFLIRFTDDLRN
jgi:hypothetical protein